MSGGAVAAAAARREAIARVLDAFRVAGATGPERARSLASLGVTPGGHTEVLQTSGVLKPGTTPDGWYLDEAAYVAQRDGTPVSSRRKTIMLVVVAVLVVLLIAAVVILVRGGPGAAHA